MTPATEFKLVQERYGPSANTLRRYKDEYLKPFPMDEWDDRISRIPKAVMGPQGLLSDDEIRSALVWAAQLKRVGDGITMKYLRTVVQDALRNMGENMTDLDNRERYINATVSRRWLRAELKRFRAELQMSARARATKKGAHNRCAAGAEWKDVAMFKKIRDAFDKVLGKGVDPEPDQLLNADEIGFDPTGKWGRVLAFLWDRENTTMGHGEHAPFWVTVWFVTAADGSLPVPPTLIHQGDRPRRSFGLRYELNKDQTDLRPMPHNWQILHSTNAYNNRELFLPVVQHLIK